MWKVPAFYVIQDTKTFKYYESRRCEATLDTTRAHFERVEGAEKQIKECQARGMNVDSWVIVPVFLSTGEPITPTIMKQKSGWVIEIRAPHYSGNGMTTTYWKGNKKKVVNERNLVSLLCDLRGKAQTVTASIFKTKAEAEKKVAEIKDNMQRLVTEELKGRPERYVPEDRWTGRRDDPEQKYSEELQTFKFKVVEV